jgi:hypothetical protein
MATTKQGVRDLNTKQQRHEHKLIPETYRTMTKRFGSTERQRMACYCGYVEEEITNEGD